MSTTTFIATNEYQAKQYAQKEFARILGIKRVRVSHNTHLSRMYGTTTCVCGTTSAVYFTPEVGPLQFEKLRCAGFNMPDAAMMVGYCECCGRQVAFRTSAKQRRENARILIERSEKRAAYERLGIAVDAEVAAIHIDTAFVEDVKWAMSAAPADRSGRCEFAMKSLMERKGIEKITSDFWLVFRALKKRAEAANL